jgi:L-lactate dehydrogenase complex protein LldG
LSGAREEILGRIRAALADVPHGERPDQVLVARAYRHTSGEAREALLERFAERVRDYHADVRLVDPDEVTRAVTMACAERGLGRLALPVALPEHWRPTGVELLEDRGLTARQLDEVDGALTGCAAAIAETGTLVLDGQGVSGRRLLTLVPDHHICLVRASQVVGSVPEAISGLQPAVVDQRLPVTLISGPSASSDIELARVEGFHGPRHLLVLFLCDVGTE